MQGNEGNAVMSDEYRSLLEEEINKNGSAVIKAKGNSMKPFIRPTEDILVIEKPGDEIKKYDVVLFYNNEKLILHRVISVHGDKLDIRGDNIIRAEKNIDKKDVFGVLTTIRHRGSEIDINSDKYRNAVKLWYALFPVRVVYMAPREMARKMFKRHRG